MLYGITLIFILLLVSGAIAWIGDWLGRRIGKKKVSVFGLRPKHTSILITIVTGILITSLTLLFIFAVSQSARDSFFGLQQLKKEFKNTRDELDNKTKEFEKVSKDLKKQEDRYSDLRKQLIKDLKKRQEELDGLVGDINFKTSELNTIKESQGKMKGEVSQLTSQRNTLENERQELMDKRDKLEKEISSIATTLVDNQKVILYGDIIYNKNQPLARIIVDTGISSRELQDNLEETISTLTDEARGKGAIIGSDAAMFHKVQINKVKTAAGETRQQIIVEASSATNVIKGEPFYVVLKTTENKIVFSKGEIISSGKIPASLSEKQVNDILSEMLTGVMRTAKDKGILANLQTGTVGTMSAARFSSAVKELTSSGHEKTVQLFSVDNTRIADKLLIDYRIK